jgi:uncharacterized protein (DUF433 family)
MNTVMIQLPQQLYEQIRQQAGVQRQTVENFVTAVLTETFAPAHPYVNQVESRSGRRAVIRGSQIGVDVIVQYSRAGYTPEEIAAEILPQLTLAEIYDALSYYAERQETLDAEMAGQTPDAWRERLRAEMGATAAAKLLGE